MRVAVIDMGTNTFHLIIGMYEPAAGMHILYKTNEPVRLGENTINQNKITDAAFKRGIDTLSRFRAIIDSYDVTTVKATATAAVRSAVNGNEFVLAAKEKAGIEIDVITGDEEAHYIFKGVKASGAITGNSLIMDIGGGSTEFILCNEHALFWKKSYDIGAARLTQAFFKSDPLSKDDAERTNAHLAATLTGLQEACRTYQPEMLIGSAGAFETFACMLSPELDMATLKFAPIHLPDYQQLAETLIRSTHTERSVMKGLIHLRVDMIVMAVLITNIVLNISKVQKIRLTTHDLKWGILSDLQNG